MRPPCLIYLSTCTGVRTGCHYLVSLSVCLCACQCMCNVRRFYRLRELYEADFHKPGIYGSGRVRANSWDVSSRAVSRWSRSPGCCGFRGVFWVGRIFFVFFFVELFFSSNAHDLLQVRMRPPCLIYLSTSGSSRRCVL